MCEFARDLDQHGQQLLARARALGATGVSKVHCRVACRGLVGQPEGHSATGDQDKTVIGGGITIDRDAIETVLRDLAGPARQQGLWNRRIGGHKTQHGRHVGSNHAGPLADSGHADPLTLNRDRSGNRLRHRVGGHDRTRRIGPAPWLGSRYRARQGCHHALNRKRLENHPS